MALLASIREPRINCVVSRAAPTDWLELMGQGGWTQEEFVREGLQDRANPTQTGGQFIDFFLRDAIQGRETLDAARRRLIASSPLYFASRIPTAQVHWGLGDAIVPVVNGRALVAAYRRAGKPASCMEEDFHPNAGHDQDRQLAPQETRAFLMRTLFGPTPATIRCR